MQFRMKLVAPLWVVALSAGAVQAQETNTAIQESTNNVLAALGAPVTPTATPEVVVNGDLIAIVGEAMANGQSDDYINALVMEAHSDGQITVPDSMTDNAGKVDSAAMLTAVVNAAIAAQPAQPAAGTRATETGGDAGDNEGVAAGTYTVKPGDTLIRIAKKYYGETGSYQQLLDANPDIINANLISIGMVLRIPE